MTSPVERLKIESALRVAVERDELELHYQPKVDTETQAIVAVEALLRWENPELGSLSPMQFIPIAEETGLIVPIGRWTLETACRQCAAWHAAGWSELSVAVNLSTQQFNHQDLLLDITDILHETGLDPTLLELEITEGMVANNPERALKVLHGIKRLGVRLAIDDFGTGYSSLGQLKNFPIDTVKIDRSFIREVPRDNEDRAITQAIISMGKMLGLTIVAEGVERIEQADFLREQTCDQMQGYYFSRAIPEAELTKLLESQRIKAAS